MGSDLARPVAERTPSAASAWWRALQASRRPEDGARFQEDFQDRLIFGTDLCYPDMPTTLTDLLIEWRDTGKISEEVFNKVARQNAVKMFGLV